MGGVANSALQRAAWPGRRHADRRPAGPPSGSDTPRFSVPSPLGRQADQAGPPPCPLLAPRRSAGAPSSPPRYTGPPRRREARSPHPAAPLPRRPGGRRHGQDARTPDAGASSPVGCARSGLGRGGRRRRASVSASRGRRLPSRYWASSSAIWDRLCPVPANASASSDSRARMLSAESLKPISMSQALRTGGTGAPAKTVRTSTGVARASRAQHESTASSRCGETISSRSGMASCPGGSVAVNDRGA
jgi:hypothetical protein